MISILLSAYNVDRYLSESIDSILLQTYVDFELICIDDGSTDNTLEILKKYEAQDNRVKIVAKKNNEGLAFARNLSLELAKGKYILFLDGDDLFDHRMLEKAHEILEKENSDIVYWDYVVFSHKKQIVKFKNKKSDLSNIKSNDRLSLLARPSFTWIKMVRTEVARKLDVRFPVGLTRQDIPVHWKLVCQIEKVSILPERLSFYRQQPNATTAKRGKSMLDLAYVMDITKEFLIKNHFYEKYKDEFLKQRLNLLFGMYDQIEKNLKDTALELILERLHEEELLYINSHEDLRRNARIFFKAIQGNFFYQILYKSRVFLRSFYRLFK